MAISTKRRCIGSVRDDMLNALIREVKENQAEDKEDD
jgi:hypothetical protein|tara:strand:+ start:992 stop:1102 length:111 start_codon:yes stop_codon:yes gene_type:complete